MGEVPLYLSSLKWSESESGGLSGVADKGGELCEEGHCPLRAPAMVEKQVYQFANTTTSRQ